MRTPTNAPKAASTTRGTGGLDSLPDPAKVDEVAAYLRVGRNRVYSLIGSGRLRALRLGRRSIRVPRAAVAELLAGD